MGRGKTVKEPALIKALDDGRVRKAILDVFSSEPLSSDSLLWSKPNVVITPHISAITSVEEGIECFVKTLQQLESGEGDLANKVDVTKGY